MAIEPEARRRAHQWAEEVYAQQDEREALFETISGEPVKPLYTREDVPADPDADLGYPGEFPFTRGVYPSMYRGRLWTMRQFAGFGTAEETNERFRYLLDHGQTGLSTAFDMPTLMGLDSDHARSLGEVGVEGVAIDTVDDMETLFAGIPLDEVTTSMTINAPAAIMLAFYVVRRGGAGGPRRPARRHDPDRHPQGVHRPEGVVLPDRAGDAPRHRHDRVVHRRDAPMAPDLDLGLPHPRGGLNGAAGAGIHAQGRLHVRRARDRARPRRRRLRAAAVSFFFNAHIDFFEEIAKYRAARRIWARELRDTYGARREESLRMRFHTQTAGVSLTAQQPLLNIVRTAIEALAGVLGGTQSLHTNSFDEALALPTEEAVRVALRTQQVIAHETGVTNTIDPLGGAYFVEALTDRDGGGGLLVLRPYRRARRHGRGDQARASRSARSPTRPSATSARSTRASGSSSASTPSASRMRPTRRSTAPIRRSSASRRARLEATKARRDRPRSSGGSGS